LIRGILRYNLLGRERSDQQGVQAEEIQKVYRQVL
jgi:hypothetical protein